jgi:uncharacterized protein YecE (DUF72 family)
MTEGRIRIGISGWRYPPWRGEFYPKGLVQKQELHFASRSFSSIEINGTFYSLQKAEYFAAWAADTPEDFVFSVKGPRYITHIKRLRDARVPLANFLASGILRLGAKLGPILWQLPPNFRFDAGQIGDFLALLPHDADAAVTLAKKHDAMVPGRAWMRAAGVTRLRHALEIRHESFRDPAFIELLRRHDVALVCADTVAWPRLMDLTSDFVYCRLHGSEQLYASGYSDDALDAWARRITAWARGGSPKDAECVIDRSAPRIPRDVFVYFDNDIKVRAPFDARTLRGKLGV